MLIEAYKPLRVHLKSGEIRMEPGHPLEFSVEDGEKLLARAPGKVRVVCRPGSILTWTRTDGGQHTGVVDFLHAAPTGTAWAFVTVSDGGWAAVNVKFVREVKP
ncbi:MAG: hypothetical protein ABIU05_06270 [Nitrospirales bacterium]